MDLWYPPDDEAPLLEWWTPLLLAASAARRERVPWPIHLDDFMLHGPGRSRPRPAVWIYKHRDSRRELNLDATGQAYKFTRTPNGRSLRPLHRVRHPQRRSTRPTCPDLRRAVWYDEPPARTPCHRGRAPTTSLADARADASRDPAPAPSATATHRVAAARARARAAATSP